MSLTAASEKPRLAGESGPRGGPKAPRILVIFNPVAGIGRKLKSVHVLDALGEMGCRVITKPTTKRGDAEAFARGLDPATVDVVVAAGGDGTINEVLNGLLGSTIPLGVIPLVTANVLAAEMGLAIDTDGVAQAIANGEPTTIYMGAFNLSRDIYQFQRVINHTLTMLSRQWKRPHFFKQPGKQVWKVGFK